MDRKKSRLKREEDDVYELAIKDFAKATINNPDFFKLSREEQKEQAMEFLQKKKTQRRTE